MKRKKQILLSCVCIGLIVCLNACSIGNKWIFSLNGEKLYDKDVIVFGLIYASEYNIQNTDQLQEIYDGNQTYLEYYKDQLEDEIISTVLLYRAAKENDYELREEEKEEVEKKAEELEEVYGKEWLEEKDIAISDIKKIYEMKVLGNSYINNQADEEEGEKQLEQPRYIKVYQVTFPTVLLDDEGMVKSNQDGTVQNQPDEEIAKRKHEADEFAKKVKSGEDMEALVKDYDSNITGVEKILKYDDLDSEYKQAVDKISEGESSDVISSEYGYYIIKLIDDNDTEYAQTVSGYEDIKISTEKKGETLTKLYDTYIGDDKDYKNSKGWEKIEITSFLK